MTAEATLGEPQVLHVLEAVGGGTLRHLLDVIAHTPARHEAAVPLRWQGALCDVGADAALAAAGAVVHDLPIGHRPPHPASLVPVLALRRLIRARRPDIVHGHSAVGGALARLAAVGTGRPVVYTPNGVVDRQPWVGLERALTPLTDLVVAVSESEEAIARTRMAVRADRLVLVPNGIDLTPPPDLFDLRSHLGLAPDTPLVGCVARLNHQKAPEVLAAAATLLCLRHPDVHVVLIGDGPDEAMVREAAAGAGDRFHLVDPVPGVSGLLPQLDVFALTSRFEGGPYTPLEALRAGVAVVLTDVVGNRDVVEHGVSGLLVAPDDPAAVADAVAELLADPTRRRAVAAAGTARLRARFGVAQMGRATAAAYRPVLERPAKRASR
ncbi:glycosyltransferase family 4 protein [soil metagenome]